MILPEIREGQIESPNAPTFPRDLRIKNFDDPPPAQSGRVLVGEMLLPFFLVKDRAHSANWQIENSPYYKFSREQFWKRVYYKQWNGSRTESKVTKIVVGMTETARKEVEDCLAVSVSADFGFKYHGAAFGIRGEIESRLKVNTSYSSQLVEETTITHSVEYSPGSRFCEAFWVLVDRYTVWRTGESHPLYEWDILREDVILEDIHRDAKLSS